MTLNGERITDEFRPSGGCRDGICPQTAIMTRRDGSERARIASWLASPGHPATATGPESRSRGKKAETLTRRQKRRFNSRRRSASQPWRLGSSRWRAVDSTVVDAFRGGVVTYPTSDTTCTTTYQVLVIDPQTLAETSYNCYDTDAELTTALGQLVPRSERGDARPRDRRDHVPNTTRAPG